jgi:putative pyruvate formate lyase activating enzyme
MNRLAVPDARFEPGYCRLHDTGELHRRASMLEAMLARCEVCPRACRVDRRRELGKCFTGCEPLVASWGHHLGDEPPISGTGGSGTIFLANCNLRCAFCQNSEISQRPAEYVGHACTTGDLASVMLELQAGGCHNINWVSPTHQVPALVRALAFAADRGLHLPIVYNTNGYDSPAVLGLLDGVVDIYMPDLKYSEERPGEELSGVPSYPDAARAAITEMFRQLGSEWQLAPDGTLRRGLLVRLLILPDGLAGIPESLGWIAGALSPEVTVSLMSQYRPAHRAAMLSGDYPGLSRAVNREEYLEAVRALARFNHSPHTLVQAFSGLGF